MIDYEKLAAIEDQHAEMLAVTHALSDRYLERVEGAREMLWIALRGADGELRNSKLHDLAAFTTEQLEERGVDVNMLAHARREYASADRLRADMDARKPATSQMGQLLRQLKRHAFPQQYNPDTLRFKQ